MSAGALTILAAIPCSTIYEAAGKTGGLAPAIQQMVPGSRLAGPAFTARAVPGDNLVVFRAIDEAPAGSVLVIEAGGSVANTIWGGMSSLACRMKGILGCVTDAAVRDIDEIRDLAFPLFAAGINVRGTVKSHPGWTGVPVVLGNVPIATGDLVFGDGDGVVVVPAARATEVAEAATKKQRSDENRAQRLKTGESITSILKI